MPLDPSIFMQGAQLKAQRDAQLSATLGNVANNYIAVKNKKAEGLDLDKLVQGVLVKKASGQELTPQDLAIGKAWDMQNSTKLLYDPGGNPRQANTSIFGGGPMSGGSVPMPAPVDAQQLGGNEFPGVQTASQGFDLGYLDPASLPAMQGVVPAPNKTAVALDFGNNTPVFPTSGNPGMMIPPNKGGMPPQPAAMQNAGGFNTDALAPQPAVERLQASPVPGNPAATYEAQKQAELGNIDLQKETQSAKIALSKEAQLEEMKQSVAAKFEKQKGIPQAEARLQESAAAIGNVSDVIKQAKSIINNRTAGIGSSIKDFPLIGKGSKSKDLEGLLNTITADAAFSELQKMRDNSPTGGALGSVAVEELKLLGAAKASLNQDQSPAQLLKNLDLYEKQRKASLARVAEAYKKDYGYLPEFEKQAESTPAKAVSYKDYFK